MLLENPQAVRVALNLEDRLETSPLCGQIHPAYPREQRNMGHHTSSMKFSQSPVGSSFPR